MRAAHASRATIFARCNAAKRLDDLSFSAKQKPQSRCFLFWWSGKDFILAPDRRERERDDRRRGRMKGVERVSK